MNLADFAFYPASELVARVKELPDAPAVYLMLFRDGDRILEVSGYFESESRLPLRLDGYDHLYTGASGTWGTRVKRHLLGDAWSSTLRRTLTSLERKMAALSRAAIPPHVQLEDEAQLGAWIAANVVVGVCETGDSFEREGRILRCEPSPLNIDQRRRAPYAQVLKSARDAAFPRQRPMMFHFESGRR